MREQRWFGLQAYPKGHDEVDMVTARDQEVMSTVQGRIHVISRAINQGARAPWLRIMYKTGNMHRWNSYDLPVLVFPTPPTPANLKNDKARKDYIESATLAQQLHQACSGDRHGQRKSQVHLSGLCHAGGSSKGSQSRCERRCESSLVGTGRRHRRQQERPFFSHPRRAR